MANFNNLALTTSGIKALLEAQTGNTLKLTKIGMGSGSVSGNTSSLKAMVTPKVTMPISEATISSDGYMTITAKMTNESLTEGFYWRETGLFFKDSNGNNVLFAYACITNDQYDYIPAYSDQRYIKHVRIANILTNTANITVEEAGGLVYVDTMTFNLYKEETDAKIEQNIISGEAEGEVIVIDNSGNAPFLGMKLYGKTTQVTTSGKNLLDVTTLSQGSMTPENGQQYDTNTRLITLPITVKENQAYSINIKDTKKTGIDTHYCYYFFNDNTFLGQQTWVTNTTFTTPANCNNIKLLFRKSDNTSVITVDDIGEIMLNEGTEALPWESYTGNAPSPSPAYQQKLKSIGTHGNILNVTLESKTQNTIDITVSKDKKVTLNGTAPSDTYIVLGTVDYKKGVEYKLSGCPSGAAANTYFMYSSVNTSTKQLDSGSGAAFTPTEDMTVTVSIKVASGTTVSNLVFEPMVSYAEDNITSYRPYSGQMEIESGVYGKNLFITENEVDNRTANGITTTVQADGGILATGTPVYDVFWLRKEDKERIILEEGTYTLSPSNVSILAYKTDTGNEYLNGTFTITKKTLVLNYRVSVTRNVEYSETLYIQLERGTEVTEFKKGNKQSHISLVGDGLKGIPVTDSSLATYTDENGQMWCSDYVDCDRGVLVQHYLRTVFTGEENIIKITNGSAGDTLMEYEPPTPIAYNPSAGSLTGALCNRLTEYTPNHGWMYDRDLFTIESGVRRMRFRFASLGITTVDGFKAKLKEWYDNGEPLEVVCRLETPIETPLSSSEIESYKALRSNYKVTTVMNDCEAYMYAKYFKGTPNGEVTGRIYEENVELKSELETVKASLAELTAATLALAQE